jgi:hypothetical protein
VLGVIGGPVVSSTRDVVFYVALAGFVAFLAWVVIVSILMFVHHPDASEVDAAPATRGANA